VPAAVVRPWHPDTQIGLLAALRIFEDRSRQQREQRNDTPAARSVPPITPMPVTRSAPTPTPANGVGPLADEPRTRLQVVSTDRELAERLAHVIPGVTVARVNVRDAGTPPPGEAPPLVLLDMRKGGVGLDAVSALRRAQIGRAHV